MKSSFGKTRIMKFPVYFLILFSSFAGFSHSDAYRLKQYNLVGSLAIKGYEPVAYFSLGKAVKGKKDFFYTDDGVSYHFSNATDQQIFQENPAKYKPPYGGWYSGAMGKDGTSVEVDPESFKIINGQLFLFYNRVFNNILTT